MKQNLRNRLLALATACMLLLPAAAGAVTAVSNETAGMVGYAISLEKILQYQTALNSAASSQAYYAVASAADFRQTVSDLTSAYYTLLSGGWIAAGYAQNVTFQQAAQTLFSLTLSLNAAGSSNYVSVMTGSGFTQAVVNFIDSYNRLPDSLGSYGGGSKSSVFYPVYALRSGIAASLTMKMATRLGPGTAYSEVLGTLPQETQITVLEQVTTGGVPWGMVEYVYNGLRYRAWTGMKRISAYQTVPAGSDSAIHATAANQTEAYYGPGTYYAKHAQSVPAGTALEVYEVENDFLLCDYMLDGVLIRAYIPWDSRVN